MSKSGLTGSRIRERRLQLGLRQVRLAQTVGISATYLNLIEHNRRKIAGKLLIDIGHALDIDPNLLVEGAQTALIEALRDAAAGPGERHPEDLAHPEDFAGRFPAWAALVAAQHRRILALEHTVEALTDRLTHDPQLATSMHEMLSVVTAIRSTAGILAGPDEIEPDWQKRFHRNLYEDSRRLAQSSQALVEYLDSAADGEAETGLTLPQEELEGWLDRRGYHFADLEVEEALPEDILGGEDGLQGSPAALSMALDHLVQYASDARAMPLAAFTAAIAEVGYDPAALAGRFGSDLAAVFRRFASLPQLGGAPRIGLVSCDSSGTLTFRKPVEGFTLPRFGAACPLWPLYQALVRPMTPVRMWVEQAGRHAATYLTYAISQPAIPPGFDMPQVFRATMLILPKDLAGRYEGAPALPIGSSCRICPRTDCAARREPSILTDGF